MLVTIFNVAGSKTITFYCDFFIGRLLKTAWNSVEMVMIILKNQIPNSAQNKTINTGILEK
jgi:hypothetical protein